MTRREIMDRAARKNFALAADRLIERVRTGTITPTTAALMANVVSARAILGADKKLRRRGRK